jgi:hypothetical protein
LGKNKSEGKGGLQSKRKACGVPVFAIACRAMNHKQRLIVLLATIILALMLLVPPYSYYRRDEGGGDHAGYGLLSPSSPRIKVVLQPDGLAIDVVSQPEVYIDISRLFVQCALILVLAVGLYLLVK